MTIKPLILLPDPLLRLVSKPVERVDDTLRKFAGDMLETMYDAPGIGLAAIQVGEPIRLLVIDLAKEGEEKAPHIFVNPEIIERSDESSIYEEGCLSIPEIYGDVERWQRVVVRALDREGKPFEVEATELLSRCLQHEIDHLHGKLFIDYLGHFKRRSALAKWEKLRKGERSLTRSVGPKEVAAHHRRDEEL